MGSRLVVTAEQFAGAVWPKEKATYLPVSVGVFVLLRSRRPLVKTMKCFFLYGADADKQTLELPKRFAGLGGALQGQGEGGDSRDHRGVRVGDPQQREGAYSSYEV